jgi:hypothetical protein
MTAISKNTVRGVYIIESLDFEDERGPMEGKLLSDILELAGIDYKYTYVRTITELLHFIDDFVASELRFLHLSFHGDKDSVQTTLEIISHIELGQILGEKLQFRRLFMSACASVNDSLAHNIMEISKCNSIVGPSRTVDMDEIAIFWASFYHLMVKNNPTAMKKKDIVSTLDSLVKLYNLPIKYYKKSSKNLIIRKKGLLLPNLNQHLLTLKRVHY